MEAGRSAVERMRDAVESTHNPSVLNRLGGFAGLYALGDFQEPVLVAGSDGVGTKVEIARAADRLDTIGIDCVAMCVNDVLCHGARPLFFLDYVAVDTLVPGDVAQIVSGVAEGCRRAECALIGGETAEMPGVYASGRFDVAGFCVGAVERNRIVDPRAVEPGMVVVGLASSGVHSNGFSLVRALFPELGDGTATGAAAASQDSDPGRALFDLFLEPTRIYVTPVLEIQKAVAVYGMAHVTGGGWYENLPRIVGADCGLAVDTQALPVPPVFQMIRERGVEQDEMYRTFNMGLGFALAVREQDAGTAIQIATDRGVAAAIVGEVTAGAGTVVLT